MLRLLFPGFFFLIVLGVYIYAFLDVISTDRSLIRNIPKIAWLMVVVLFPPIGAVAWFAFGRPLHAGFMPGSVRPNPSREWRGEAAEDGHRDWVDRARAARSETESDEEWERRLAEWEADLQARHDEIEGREADPDDREAGSG